MAKALSTYVNNPHMSMEAQRRIKLLLVYQKFLNEAPSYVQELMTYATNAGEDDRITAPFNGRRKTVAQAPLETRPYVATTLGFTPTMVKSYVQLLSGVYDISRRLAVTKENVSAYELAQELLNLVGHDAASAPNMMAFWQAEVKADTAEVEQGEDFPQVDESWAYWEDLFGWAIYGEDDLIEVHKQGKHVYVLLASDPEEETALYAIMPMFIADEQVTVTREFSAMELQSDRGESIPKGTTVVLHSVDYNKDAPTATVWYRNKTWRLPMKNVKI